MAQAQLFYRAPTTNSSTQTGDYIEFFEYLSKTKTIHMYWSESYKDYVVCLSFFNCKKYIITRPMWKRFRNFFSQIDNVLNTNSRV